MGLVGLVLWLVPGLALIKSKINSGELTYKYQILSPSSRLLLLAKTITHAAARSLCDS